MNQSRIGRIGVVQSGMIVAALLMALLGGQSTPVQAQECTYYVAPTGSDSNPGDIDHPWQTLSKANAMLVAGQTLCIRAGTYDEVIEPYNSGAPGKKITYTNYQDESVLVRGEPGIPVVVSIGWKFHGPGGDRSYTVIDGLQVRGDFFTGYVDGFGYPRNVFIYGEGSTHNEIRNLTIVKDDPVELVRTYGRAEYGISISKASHNLLEHNFISGMSRIGIIGMGGGRYNVIRNNTILNCYQSNIDLGSSNWVVQGTLIEGNVLGGSIIEDGIQFENCYSCGYDENNPDIGSNRGTIVRNNVIYGAAENGIDLKGASLVIIEGNYIYHGVGDNNGLLGKDGVSNEPDRGGGFGGIYTGAGATTDSRDVIVRNNIIYDNNSGVSARQGYKVYNNVIWGNNRDYTGPNSTWIWTRKPAFKGITVWHGHSGVSVINNIVGQHATSEASARSGAGLRIDNNLYFNQDGVFLTDFRDIYDWDNLTFSEWSQHLEDIGGITGMEEHSLVAAPLFVSVPALPVGDYDQYDFHLQPESPAINAGAFLTETTSAGSGTILPVKEAGYFTDGLGVTTGDEIQLQDSNERAHILTVDYETDILTLDRPLTWSANQGVALPYEGTAPDIGAIEFAGETPTFVDVPFDHWAYDEIEALYQAGYVAGCSTDPLMYCPEATMTRAESAVFVERGVHGAGYLPADPTGQIFADVPIAEWFAKWATGLYEDGYTAGCGKAPLSYCPLQTHTRTEGTVFFLRMLNGAGYVPPDAVGIFADVDPGFWGAKWAEAAYNAGLIPACGTSPDLKFCPDDPLDRAMGAYMMVQAKGLSVP